MIQESARILSLRTKFTQARAELQQALAEDAHTDVADYVFATPSGSIALSALFGQKRDLFVIHNMGTGCSNCTMWADGFNGLYPHIADRAAFVVSSPDPPSVQADFAAMRGWTFAMVSTAGGSFAVDMGFADGTGRNVAGVSAFQMQQGKIIRVSAAGFDGTDEFCAVWRLFDLLPERADGWRPKQRYR